MLSTSIMLTVQQVCLLLRQQSIDVEQGGSLLAIPGILRLQFYVDVACINFSRMSMSCELQPLSPLVQEGSNVSNFLPFQLHVVQFVIDITLVNEAQSHFFMLQFLFGFPVGAIWSVTSLLTYFFIIQNNRHSYRSQTLRFKKYGCLP